MYSKLNSKRH